MELARRDNARALRFRAAVFVNGSKVSHYLNGSYVHCYVNGS